MSLALAAWVLGLAAGACDREGLATLCASCDCRATHLLCPKLPPKPSLQNAIFCNLTHLELGQGVSVVPWEDVAEAGLHLTELRLRGAAACDCANSWLHSASLDEPVFSEFAPPGCASADCSFSRRRLFQLPTAIRLARDECARGPHSCGSPRLRGAALGGGLSYCEVDAGHCVVAVFLPFLAESAGRLRFVNSAENAEGCARRVEVDSAAAAPGDGGWLICRVSPEFPPLVLPIRIPGPPTLSATRTEVGGDYHFTIHITAHPPHDKLDWYFDVNDEISLSEQWHVELKSLHDPPKYVLEYAKKSFLEGGIVKELTVNFVHPELNCNYGTYHLKVCNPHGCASKKLIVPSTRRATCAKANVTMLVLDGASDSLEEHSQPNADSGTEDEPTTSQILTLRVAVPISAAMALMLCSAAIGWLLWRRRKMRANLSHAHELQSWVLEACENSTAFVNNHVYVGWVQSLTQQQEIPVIPWVDMRILSRLGEGAFGEVFLVSRERRPKTAGAAISEDSSWPLLGDPSSQLYAMKQLKSPCAEQLQTLEKEAAILLQLSHPNIVRFHGLCLRADDFGLLFEHMDKGDLLTHLRTHSPDSRCRSPSDVGAVLSLAQLLHYAVDVASGLEYLRAESFVHRDVAARNCLVDAGDVVKISDFGMSKSVLGQSYYRVGEEALMPLRWLPPESVLYRRFTVESDAWAFGVLLWEVFSFGRMPWAALSNSEVVARIETGTALERPELCPEVLYRDVLLPCWDPEPARRLHPKDARQTLAEYRAKLNTTRPCSSIPF